MPKSDASTRCPWPGDDPLYIAYHDEEWGVPEYDDRALFEKLILDGFQAGLSWITILRKRDSFRDAFDGFDPERMARYTPKKVEKLLQNAGIIRHRGKIEASISNAQAWLDIMEQGDGFSNFIWSHVDHKPVQNNWRHIGDVPAANDMSVALSKALKKQGFKFCGPTIAYAFAQAIGLVNDHITSCPRHKACIKLAATKMR